MEIEIIPLLRDNYAYLLHDPESQVTAIIDPSDAQPVLRQLKEHGLTLDYILNTHHHWDHTDGNLEIKAETGCNIVGFKGDAARIPGIDIVLDDGDIWRFGAYEVHIAHIPGHTLGAIYFYFPQIQSVFTGDTLFAMGCGRLFEGTAEQMYHSLQKILLLPDDTHIYSGHEYTEVNGRFALTLDPNNNDLQKRMDQIRVIRQKNQPTQPFTLQQEKQTNPFLRADNIHIKQLLNMEKASDIEVFAEIRRRKDAF